MLSIPFSKAIRTSAVAVALFATASVGTAFAETQTFKNPKAWNKAVNWCVEDGGPCGAVSADLFCQTKNFKEAKSFAAASAKEPSVYLNNGEVCKAAECKILTTVTCEKGANSGGIDVEASVETGVGEVNDGEEGQSPNEFPTIPIVKTYTKGMAKGDASLVKLPEGFGGEYGVFVRGMDDALWMTVGDGKSAWKGWNSLGNELSVAPSCTFVPIGAFGGGGSVYCAIVTKTNDIRLIDMKSGVVIKLDGKTKFAPSLVYGNHTDGRRALYLFVRANDGQLSVKQFIPSDSESIGAKAWKGLGYKLSGAPSCLWMGGNHFDCYYRDGEDNTIEAAQVLQGGQVVNLEGKTKKRLGPILTDKKQRVRVLVKGLDDKLWVRNWTPATGFQTWKQVAEVDVNSQPACLQTNVAPARMTCIDVAADSKINALNFSLSLTD